MIFKHNQNWRTSNLPFSLALANTVNTGVSFDTPSGGIRNRKVWASAGFGGYGPRIQYGAGLDGLGCGCGCGCDSGGSPWVWAAVAVAAFWLLRDHARGGMLA